MSFSSECWPQLSRENRYMHTADDLALYFYTSLCVTCHVLQRFVASCAALSIDTWYKAFSHLQSMKVWLKQTKHPGMLTHHRSSTTHQHHPNTTTELPQIPPLKDIQRWKYSKPIYVVLQPPCLHLSECVYVCVLSVGLSGNRLGLLISTWLLPPLDERDDSSLDLWHVTYHLTDW